MESLYLVSLGLNFRILLKGVRGGYVRALQDRTGRCEDVDGSAVRALLQDALHLAVLSLRVWGL